MKAAKRFSALVLAFAAGVAGPGQFSTAAGEFLEFRFAAGRAITTVRSGFALAAADFNGDGRADLAAGNYQLNLVSILIADGFGTFQPPVSYVTGQSPEPFATGDFTNDGKLDLLLSYQSNLAVLPGNGDGTFQAPVSTLTSVGKGVVGDVNNDGKLDLAYGPAILFGNGGGAFPTSSGALDPTDLTGVAPAIADMNRDGKPDIITVSPDTRRLSVITGNGNGTFVAPPAYYPVLANARLLAAGDFNEDQWPDVIVPNSNAGTTALFLNQGNGTLLFMEHLPTPGTNALQVVVADFDNDTHLDFAVLYSFSSVNSVTNDVVVTRGRGNGTFESPVHHQLGSSPTFLAVGDLDGDGVKDLALSTSDGGPTTGHAMVLLGNGDATFQSTPAYASGPGPRGVKSADLNGDNRPDLIVANSHTNNVTVLLNNGVGGFLLSSNYYTGKNPQMVAAADFDGDAVPDLMVANLNTNKLSLLAGRGDGTFLGTTGAISILVGTRPMVAGRFNGDAHQDVVAASIFGASFFPGLGNGTFGASIDTPGLSITDEMTSELLNADQSPDLVMVRLGSTNVSIMLSNGNGTFQAPVNYLVSSNAQAVAVADLTGDGIVDLAVASFGCATCSVGDLSILRGNGNGTFQPALKHAVLPGQRPIGIAAGDFNGDGFADLAVTDLLSLRVTLWRGIGDGTFDSPQRFDVRNGALQEVGCASIQGANPALPVLSRRDDDGRGMGSDSAGPNIADKLCAVHFWHTVVDD